MNPDGLQSAEQENGCRTSGKGLPLDKRISLRLTSAMGARWQQQADAQGIDLAVLIRRTMEGRRMRPTAGARRDDLKHLSRMALWSVEIIGSLVHLTERSQIDAEQAADLQVTLYTLLELFSAVANGEVTEEQLPPPADASTLSVSPNEHVSPPS